MRALSRVALIVVLALTLALAVLALVLAISAGGDDEIATEAAAQESRCPQALEDDTDSSVERGRERQAESAGRRQRSRGRKGGRGKVSRNRRAGGRASSRLTLPQSVDNQGQPSEGATELNFPFGRSRDEMLRHQTFRLPPGMSADAVTVTPINEVGTTGTGRTIPTPQQIDGTVVRIGPGRLFTVAVCIDPAQPTAVTPASYTGGLLVGHSERVAPLSLRASVQDNRWWRVLLAAALGVGAGLVVKLIADRKSEGIPNQLGANLRSPRTWLVALGAGVITGVYSYLTIYNDDPTFNADFANLWRVTAEAFTGTIAAKALTDLAGPSAPGKRASPPTPG